MRCSGDGQSIYKDFSLFSKYLSSLFGWYPSYILYLYGILFQEMNYVSYKELPVLGEEGYLDFSFLKVPVCIPAGFPESWPFTGLIHQLTDALLMLFISDTWWIAFSKAEKWFLFLKMHQGFLPSKCILIVLQ